MTDWIRHHLSSEVFCVIDTINKAKARRNIDQPLISHSDCGSRYVAKEYKKVSENMQRSYSKKAFLWDNACIESFHSIIKRGKSSIMSTNIKQNPVFMLYKIIYTIILIH